MNNRFYNLVVLAACGNKETAGHESATSEVKTQRSQPIDSMALEAGQDPTDTSQFDGVNSQGSLFFEQTYDRIFHIPEVQGAE